MSEETIDEVILTPIYKNEIYQYHQCSNCNKEIYLEEDIFIPFYFKEKIKYCPFCGKKIVRYDEPKYIENPKFDWLDKYAEIIDKAYRNMEYEVYCKNSKEEINELRDKANFGIKYFGSSLSWNDKSSVCKMLKEISGRNCHYSYKEKLKKEFEKTTSNK